MQHRAKQKRKQNPPCASREPKTSNNRHQSCHATAVPHTAEIPGIGLIGWNESNSYHLFLRYHTVSMQGSKTDSKSCPHYSTVVAVLLPDDNQHVTQKPTVINLQALDLSSPHPDTAAMAQHKGDAFSIHITRRTNVPLTYVLPNRKNQGRERKKI